MNKFFSWMVKCSILVALILFLGLAVLSGPNQGLTIKSIKVSAHPEQHSGDCPYTFKFKAKIIAEGKGEIVYRWIRSNGFQGQKKKLSFMKSGEKDIYDSWKLGTKGKKYKDYWEAVEILQPEQGTSNRATFTLDCDSMRFTMPTNEISGTVRAVRDGRNLGGRKIKIHLYKSGRRIFTQEKSLREDGSVDYKFRRLLFDDYRIEVEKGPSDPDNYTSTANWCFDGTDPERRYVTLDSSHRVVTGQDFDILYSLLWDAHELCW
jgi:hypothetical protein